MKGRSTRSKLLEQHRSAVRSRSSTFVMASLVVLEPVHTAQPADVVRARETTLPVRPCPSSPDRSVSSRDMTEAIIQDVTAVSASPCYRYISPFPSRPEAHARIRLIR